MYIVLQSLIVLCILISQLPDSTVGAKCLLNDAYTHSIERVGLRPKGCRRMRPISPLHAGASRATHRMVTILLQLVKTELVGAAGQDGMDGQCPAGPVWTRRISSREPNPMECQ